MGVFKDMKALLFRQIQTLEADRSSFVRNPDSDFTRKRKLSFQDTVKCILSMEAGSIQSELLKYFSFSADTVTPSAFIQQRAKIRSEAFQSLFFRFSGMLPSRSRQGYHFLAVDGSEILVPLEKGMDSYSYFKKQGQRDYFQVHLDAVYDLISERYVSAYLGPRKNHNEREAFHTMFEQGTFPDRSIFLFDRGYEGYPLMAHISKKNQFFVIRAKDCVTGGILKGLPLPETEEFDYHFDKTLVGTRVKELRLFPERYHLVHRTKSPYFLNDTVREYPLSFRVVRFLLDNGTYECLLTNLPAEEFSISDLKEVYHLRWGIETAFRHLKYTVNLLSFHSKKIESIEQEIWARLLLYNFCSAVTSQIKDQERIRKYHYKVNFANAVNVCRRFLKHPEDGTLPDIEELISREMLPIRPKRTFPRISITKVPRKFNYRVL